MFNETKESDRIGTGGNLKLPYFFNLVRITGFRAQDSKNGQSTQFKLELEGKNDDPEFEGFERLDKQKAKGPLAEVDIGIFIKATNFPKVAELMSNLSLIAIKSGVDYNKELAPGFAKAFTTEKNAEGKEVPIALKEETQEYLKKVVGFVVGVIKKHSGYFWMFITTSEYQPGKFGDYKFLEYNVGDKNNLEFVVWVKSEACVQETFQDDDNKRITVGVKGVNQVGVNKGESFTKMREVGNEYQLKPYKADEYEDTASDMDDLTDESLGDADLPF